MMKYLWKKRNKKGFTLVELLVVVAIVAVLAVVAVPRLTSATDGARLSALEGNVDTIKAGLVLYAADHGGDLPPSGNLKEIEPYLSEKIASDSSGAGADVISHFKNRPTDSLYSWDGKTLKGVVFNLNDISKYTATDKRAGKFEAKVSGFIGSAADLENCYLIEYTA